MTRPTIESKPIKNPVEQVFLSPRVLDRTAFEEFSGALRALMERAAESTRTLQESASQADAVYARLTQVSPNIEAKVADVEKAVRSIMSVRDEAFTLLSRAEACVQQISGAEAHIEAVIEERLAAFRNRMQMLVDQAEDRAAEGVTRAVQQSHMELAVVEARLGDVGEQIRELSSDSAGLGTICDRAAALLGREASDPAGAPGRSSLAEAILVAERTIAELHATGDQLASGRGAAERARHDLAQAILDAAALCDDLKRRDAELREASGMQAGNSGVSEAPAHAPLLAEGRREEFGGWFKLSQEIEAKPARRKRAPRAKKAARKA